MEHNTVNGFRDGTPTDEDVKTPVGTETDIPKLDTSTEESVKIPDDAFADVKIDTDDMVIKIDSHDAEIIKPATEAATETVDAADFTPIKRGECVVKKNYEINYPDSTMKMFCPSGRLNAEDALPILTDRFMHVADGLGGSGGFAHSTIKREATDNDKFFDTLFTGVFSDKIDEGDREVLRSYVNDSFSKYFSLTAEDKTSRSCICTSGYFASRIASTLIYSYMMGASKLKDGGKDKIEKMLEELSGAGEGLAAREEEIGAEFATRLYEDMGKVAANGNLVYDAGVKGLILLPTTMVSILYKESENYVDALYLWAGDSRGYAWDKNGLIQVTEDHEKDGIMTNMVNRVTQFKVSAKYVRVQKPCMLFATSDGCYTCMSSALDFEYYFFDQFKGTASMDEAMQKIYKIYSVNSQDDSNTVSLRAFGYGSYENLISDIGARVDDLVKTYDGELHGIFDVNFRQELSAARRKLDRAMTTVDVSKSEVLKTAVLAKLPIKEEMEAKKRAVDAKIEGVKAQIAAIVDKNFKALVPPYIKSLAVIEHDFEKRIAKYVEDIDTNNTKLLEHAKIEAYHFGKKFTALQSFLGGDATEIDVESACRAADEFVTFAEDVRKYLRDYWEFMYAKKGLLSQRKPGLITRFEAFLEENRGYAREISRAIISGKVELSVFSSLECYGEIEMAIAEIADLKNQLSDAGMQDVVNAKILEYWKKNAISITAELYSAKPDCEFFATCEDDFVSLVENYVRCLANLEKRDELYARYEVYYYGKKEMA